MDWVENTGQGPEGCEERTAGSGPRERKHGPAETLSPDPWTANSAACLGVSAVLSSASLSIHIGPGDHYYLDG